MTLFRTLLDDAAPHLDLARVTEPMTRYAFDLAQAYPTATADALADKLLTIWPGSPRPLRTMVALAAMERAATEPKLAA